MKYFQLCNDEFDEERPGIQSDVVRGVLTGIHSRVGGEGEMSVLGVDTAGPIYYVLLENPDHVRVFEHYLARRNIWHRILDHMPATQPDGAERDETIGVIFFRLSARQIRPPAVKGAVHNIAALVDEMSEGAFVLRGNFFRDEEQGVYWVGLNDVSAGQMFAYFLKSQDVPIVHRDSLPGGRRPRLPEVSWRETQTQAAEQAEEPPRRQRQRREAPRQDPEARAEGQGFAVMGEIIRRKFGRGSGEREGLRAKMERRFNRRPRGGDDARS